ncbi:hypothetical protein [Nannocystis pusilla]|uniref:hypothetical protein n=1 Tax=Nannocystis pusilla TaxID=889268 RepID=UPI003B7D451F
MHAPRRASRAQALAVGIAGQVAADERINAYFLNAQFDGGRFLDCLVDQLATLAGCPGATYTCKGMKSAHTGLGVSAIDFSDFVADVATALDEHQAGPAPLLTDADKVTLLDALAAMAGRWSRTRATTRRCTSASVASRGCRRWSARPRRQARGWRG